jgi:methylenetetrahydrofolate reductase (NADPH)
MGEPSTASARDRVRDRVVALMDDVSIELTPREVALAPSVPALLPAATTAVYLTYLSSIGYAGTIDEAVRLTGVGVRVIPHIAARALTGERQLDDLLARLTGEAGVTEVLVIAGGIAKPAGPYAASIEVLRSGLLQRHGISAVGVAGHPEGSPDIDAGGLAQAIADKNELARDTGLSMQLVTQFVFAPQPVVAWERALREAGNQLPVRVGLPGLVSAARLLKFGIMCGVGPSLAIIRKKAGSVVKLVSAKPQLPDGTPPGVARAAVDDPAARFSAFHFFPFGGFEATATWAGAVRAGRFTLPVDEDRIITAP